MWDEIFGGLLIGLAAAVLWLGVGRISGMTGVLSSVFQFRNQDRHWSWAFLVGLMLAWPMVQLVDYPAPISITDKPFLLIAAGLLVGFGTYVGNGCTSGHGVCGMGRLSFRSAVATVTFMLAGVITVAVMTALEVQI